MRQDRAADDRHCAELLKAEDPEAWLAALFVPAETRPHIHALRAAFLEFGRVRDRVKQPLAGELRLQWWADALAGEARGDAEAHPVAAALLDTVERFALPQHLVSAAIEAHRAALYDAPLASEDDLLRHCAATLGGRVRLEGQVLAGRPAETLAFADDAGAALGLAAVLRSLHGPRPRTALVPDEVLERTGPSRGMLDANPGECQPVSAALRGLARAHLQRMRAAAATIPVDAAPALLPVALVEPLLRLSERRSGAVGEGLALPRWRVQWILWRAARTGRF